MSEKLKKTLAGLGVLAAFGLGGTAIAGAQSDAPAGKQATEQGESNEAEQQVTGADADRAGQAALKSVGEGKVLAVEKEAPEQGTEKPEPGEKPDSAQERAIDQETAYEVEIRKGDGTTVDVALDGAFNVLDSEQDSEDSSK